VLIDVVCGDFKSPRTTHNSSSMHLSEHTRIVFLYCCIFGFLRLFFYRGFSFLNGSLRDFLVSCSALKGNILDIVKVIILKQ
jgi:hypothetical protein